jgi:hypothetical protein
VSADERMQIYRRYTRLALEHWRDDERGRAAVAEFLAWHLNFWCRYVPRRADGTWPTMQERQSEAWATTPLERLLARPDEAAHAWLAAQLVAGAPIDPEAAPPVSAPVEMAIDAAG